MDPRVLQALLEEVAHNSNVDQTRPGRRNGTSAVDPRRYAIYYADSESETSSSQNINDNENAPSCWEFEAAHPPTRNFSNATCSSSTSTAAQDIIMAYRARSAVTSIATSVTSVSSGIPSMPLRYTPCRTDSDSPTDADFEVIDRPMSKCYNPLPIYRRSREVALEIEEQEAFAVMASQGARPNEQIVCQRPGCRETLRNVSCLTYHLHIHDMSVACTACKGFYENPRELKGHQCEKRRLPSPALLRFGIRRIFKKLSLRS
ncbi:hypothetical protein CVT24_009124 [Panaeolus cyanescens]|uniref:C2H2-type domain-containing protein n=1 Tax=Panaeolus cyanescens TaxID=181874 RepID=A0A409VCP6_9AGAR|nr:hypothetical protein CVT24_009124 [Panaeolus cyanescens]